MKMNNFFPSTNKEINNDDIINQISMFAKENGEYLQIAIIFK